MYRVERLRSTPFMLISKKFICIYPITKNEKGKYSGRRREIDLESWKGLQPTSHNDIVALK